MSSKKYFGWIPDIPDQRDYLYQVIKPVIRLPKELDLRNFCSLVENQGRLGSCTANAIAGNLEFLDVKGIIPCTTTGTVPAKLNLKVVLRGLSHTNNYTDVSRLFIYYNERVLIGSEDYDSGASLRDGIKTLKKVGYCWEETWPYMIAYFDRKPPQRCYIEAKKHRIRSYHRISSLSEMFACLAEGYPFVFGFAVYESFESRKVSRTGIVNMPEKKERVIGGHAVMAAGYNQKTRRFLVRNSWGHKWGQGGYFTMPFEYLETLSADFWTIRK